MKHRARLYFVTALLLALSACAEAAYEHMNAPSRDAWQQPKAVIQGLNLQPDARVADLGAGGGYFTFPLAEAVGPEGRVYAVDVDEASLKYIDKQAKQRGVFNLELILANQHDPRLPPTGVDLNLYLQHLPPSHRPRRIFQVTRALSPAEGTHCDH